MSRCVDYQWVQDELIPFLDSTCGPQSGHPKKTKAEWEAEIRSAAGQFNTIRNYDDSIISIDRVRLALIHSPALAIAKRTQADLVASDQELCITLFVRHAITHGSYPLFSAGLGPSAAAVREREALRQRGEEVPEIYKALTTPRSRLNPQSDAFVRERDILAAPSPLCAPGSLANAHFPSPSNVVQDIRPKISEALAYSYPPSSPRLNNVSPHGYYHGYIINQRTGEHVGGMPQTNPDLGVYEYDVLHGVNRMTLQGASARDVGQSTLRGEALEFNPGVVEHGGSCFARP